jgi:hypothetical protein
MISYPENLKAAIFSFTVRENTELLEVFICMTSGTKQQIAV